MKEQKVYVAIVTYNRKEYLLNLLEALQQSEKKISGILLLDNKSTDGTNQTLMEIGFTEKDDIGVLHENTWKSMKTYYFRNTENAGGAGGFAKLFELSMSLSWDYLWVMDDDVYPEPDCLTNLLKYIGKDAGVCIPSRSDGRYEDEVVVGINLKSAFRYAEKRKNVIRGGNLTQDYVEVVDMPFEGPLFTREIVEKIGVPDKNYIILYDDSDYARRALNYTKIRYIPSAMLHKAIILVRDKKQCMTWKDYYSYRNSIHFIHLYGESWRAKHLCPIYMAAELILRALVRRKYSNIKVILRAYRDGVHENMGKTVEPGAF